MSGGSAHSQISPPPWMTGAGARAVCQALGAQVGGVRFVGGCVRDAILGLMPEDVDLATIHPPDEVMRRLRDARIKAVPTGVEHGTVTAIVPPEQFQITSLRRDVETDGRHAIVHFGTSWQEDAARRDFTINAIYADVDGNLFDPVGGIADLADGIVRFIGDAEQRVREDYLRILRFFRFHARFGSGAADPASLAACSRGVDGLAVLSAERVRDELIKLLALPNAAAALEGMQTAGILSAVFPEATLDAAIMARLAVWQARAAELGLGSADDPWPRLFLLVGQAGGAAADRLRLSNAQRHRLEQLRAVVANAASRSLLAPSDVQSLAYDCGIEAARDCILLAASKNESDGEAMSAALKALVGWRRPVFPLRGSDLLRMGLRPSPTVGGLLSELERWWRDGGFIADREACLAEMRSRIRLEEIDLATASSGNETEGGAGSGGPGDGSSAGEHSPKNQPT